MFKYTVVILAVIAFAAAKPSGLIAPLALSAPLVAPGVVTATSSQVIARNYNGLAATPVIAAAPLAAQIAAPLAASPLALSVGSPLVSSLAYSAPLAAAPLGLASPLSAPLLW